MEWPKDMLEEIEDLRSERSIRSLKSNEEIEKLSVDEKLGPLERALYLLRNGQDVQKMSVILGLSSLMTKNPMETQKKVLPKICDLLPSSQVEFQVAAASAFSSLLENKQLTTQAFNSILFHVVLNGVENKDSVISGAWLKTLLVAVGSYSPEVIKREILPLALSKGQLSQPVSSRLASCEILGVIATKFDGFRVRRELLNLVNSLCQDVDYEVRSCMCRQLEAITKQLGPELSGTLILPELVELTKDEECSVRIASLETLVSLVDQLDKDVKKSTVVPLLQQCFESALALKDASLQAVCHLYGRFCHSLKESFNEAKHQWFLDFYRQIALLDRGSTKAKPAVVILKTVGSPSPGSSIADDPSAECRRLCAYNFPAMALFVEAHNFSHDLASTLQSLVTDQHSSVRRTVATGFHEVAKLLGPSLVGSIRSQFITLLKESSLEVLQGFVPHLSDCLRVFARDASLEGPKFAGLPEFIPCIISCSQTISKSRLWRLHEELVHQYSSLPDCLTSDQIYYKFIPRTFKLLSSKHVLPLKLAAGRTLCILIRHNRRKEQRREMCDRVIGELGGSRSYWNRLLFIDFCSCVLELFSKRYFKTMFFEFILVLAKDPVANVRLRLCRFLPRLKSVLKLPTDRALLQQFQLVTRHLLTTEKDPDVQAGIAVAFKELDRVDIPVETLSGRTFFEDDLLDAKKEEEEKQVEMEEELEAMETEKEGTKQTKQAGETKKTKSAKKPGGKHSKLVSQASPAVQKKGSLGSGPKLSPTQVLSANSKTSYSGTGKLIGNKSVSCDRLFGNLEPVGDQKFGKRLDQATAASSSSASPRIVQKRSFLPPLSPTSPKPSTTLAPPSPLFHSTKIMEGPKSPVSKASHSHDGATAASVSGSTSRSASNSPHGKPKFKPSSLGTSSPSANPTRSSQGKKESSSASNGPLPTALNKSAKPKT